MSERIRHPRLRARANGEAMRWYRQAAD